MTEIDHLYEYAWMGHAVTGFTMVWESIVSSIRAKAVVSAFLQGSIIELLKVSIVSLYLLCVCHVGKKEKKNFHSCDMTMSKDFCMVHFRIYGIVP